MSPHLAQYGVFEAEFKPIQICSISPGSAIFKKGG